MKKVLYSILVVSAATILVIASVRWPGWYLSLKPEKPDALLAAGIAVFGTIVGAWATNVFVHKREMEGRNHALKEKAVEREFNLRKDIYIALVEALPNAIKFVASSSSKPVAESADQGPFEKLAALITRLNLVASKPVLESGFQLLAKLSILNAWMVTQRMANEDAIRSARDLGEQSDQAEREGDELGQTISAAQARASEMLEAAKQQAVKKQSDAAAFKDLVEDIKLRMTELTRLQQQGAELRQQCSRAWFESSSIQLGIAKRTRSEITELTKLTCDFHVAMRSELGFPIDAQWLLDFQRSMGQNVGSELDKMIDSLERRIADQGKEEAASPADQS